MDKEGGDQATVDEINKVQKLGLVALTWFCWLIV
jgi:hypothetical protein